MVGFLFLFYFNNLFLLLFCVLFNLIIFILLILLLCSCTEFIYLLPLDEANAFQAVVVNVL